MSSPSPEPGQFIHPFPDLVFSTVTVNKSLPFSSRFPFRLYHQSDAALVIRNVQQYFIEAWPWRSQEACDDYLKSDLELFTLVTYPYTLPDLVEIVASVVNFSFLLDDLVDESWSKEQSHAVLGSIFALTQGDQMPDFGKLSKLEAVAVNIFSKVREYDANTTSNFGKDMCKGMLKWYIELGREDTNELSAKGLESYFSFRLGTAGIDGSHTIVKSGAGIEFPNHLMEEKLLVELGDTVGRHGSLINDMYSYRREMKAAATKKEDPKALINAVVISMNEKKLDEAQAFDFLKEYVARLEDKLLSLEEKLKTIYADGDEWSSLERYINGQKAVCAGNWVYATVSGRYNFDS